MNRFHSLLIALSLFSSPAWPREIVAGLVYFFPIGTSHFLVATRSGFAEALFDSLPEVKTVSAGSIKLRHGRDLFCQKHDTLPLESQCVFLLSISGKLSTPAEFPVLTFPEINNATTLLWASWDPPPEGRGKLLFRETPSNLLQKFVGLDLSKKELGEFNQGDLSCKVARMTVRNRGGISASRPVQIRCSLLISPY